MAWTAVKDFVAGAILTAADMDTYVSANTDYLKTQVDLHHVLAGSSASTYAKSGGVLDQQGGLSAGNSSTTNTTLWTYSMAANVLGATGDMLVCDVLVQLAGNSNQKDITFVLGSSALTIYSAAQSTHTYLPFTVWLMREGAAAERVWAGPASNYGGAAWTETLTGALDVMVKGQGVNTNDIILRGVSLRYERAV